MEGASIRGNTVNSITVPRCLKLSLNLIVYIDFQRELYPMYYTCKDSMINSSLCSPKYMCIDQFKDYFNGFHNKL